MLPDSLNRTFSLRFQWQASQFVNIHSFPVHNSGHHQKSTIYHPPPHYHIFADEYFHVSRGTGIWHLWDRDVRLKEGDKIKVPARCWHWFEGEPSADAPLEVQVYYDKGQAEMEERFFRNVLGYLADCHRENLEPSILQLLIFFYYFDMTPGLRAVRWESLNFILNAAVTYIGTVIGLLLGYKTTYPEYYHADKKTM